MPRDDLLALAERCEKATGADRGLDGLIARAVYPNDSAYAFAASTFHLTASLDAAVALKNEKLPGWGYVVGKFDGNTYAAMKQDDEEPDDGHVSGKASTPALALMAALLRALASSNKEGGNRG